jgi:hypothetical protein
MINEQCDDGLSDDPDDQSTSFFKSGFKTVTNSPQRASRASVVMSP